MNKRTLLALLLIFIVFYLSSKFLWKTPPKQPEQAIQTARKEIKPESRETKEKVSETQEYPFGGRSEENLSEVSLGKGAELNENIVLENDVVKIIFTNKGGNIKQIYLQKIMMGKDNKMPVKLLPSEKDFLNITLNIDSESINLSNYNLEYSQSDWEVEFFIEQDSKKILKKKFTLENNYNLTMNLFVEDFGLIESYDLEIDAGVYYDQKGDKRFKNYIKAVSQINNNIEKVSLKNAEKGEKLFGNVSWTVLKSKYFMLVTIPHSRVKLRELSIFASNNEIKEIAKVEVSRLKIEHDYDFYFGPVDYDNLRAFNIGLENSMDFGMKIIRPISKLILQLLKFLYKIIPNYGIAIIIMSIIIKILFYPLTHKGMRSTHKMQEIQPLIKETQKRYKNNPQKAQKEIMALYKEHGVSPLGGCLPLLLQMPVFFALYPVLQSTIALRHANFILWIKDLSVPDPYYILPIIMGISMFLQQKLMSPKPTPNMDEKQLAQIKTQKMMMYGMPIFLVFIFKSLPAGLVLYWLSYNILSIGEQILIRKGGIRKAESGM
ncbi:MAG: membrane protein insertase YidC [Candidatus Cloacimonetes bacterium]|nr:membrane protein insertase YidC [Candidatus Cloacimonadota bacterium]